jgi:tetratricopeptide (TPR) repeat protein
MQAQFGALVSPFNAPQARSQQELDDYLDVMTATNPATTVQRVEEFASKYPKSELLGFAFQYQMLAYQGLNDLDGVLRAGRRALELQPGNVNTLLTLASAIPDGTKGRDDEVDLLKQADDYAHQSLQSITTMQIPRQVSLQEWATIQADMVAQAHEALGHIATERGELPRAITELELAAYGSATPNGRQFFRLGVAYALAGEKEPAEKALHRAADLGPELIRQRALDALQRMRSKSPIAPGKSSDR